MMLTVGIDSTLESRMYYYYLGNHNIRELDSKWYRHHIGFVSQEPVLFACSIADNISYGRENATKEEVSSTVNFTSGVCLFITTYNVAWLQRPSSA